MDAVKRLARKLDDEVRFAYVYVPPHPSHTEEGRPIWVRSYGYNRDLPLGEAVASQAAFWRLNAEVREPETTKTIRDVAADTGGEMADLAYRLKEMPRLRQKIETEAVEQGLLPSEVEIKDALRFTIVYDHDTYASSARTALRTLQERGYVVKTKNWWQRGDAYNGLNVALTSPDGFPVELQFHTQTSFDIARENHVAYARFRTLTAEGLHTRADDPRLQAINAERRVLFEQMVELADSQPIPPGIEGLPTERWDGYKDLPGLPCVALPPTLAAASTAPPS